MDHLSSQRRPLSDRLGLEGELLAVAPLRLGELGAATRLPTVARAHATHLLWQRHLGVDLGVRGSEGLS
ncbi:hypothetical protein ACIGXM_31600 [Kitasatospora sp. NPDC052896]|uniref:hypothetical protein n=1 Tax=Kitasatospora sp. NPDC052896 TaxID=3364061 RepID=UPI0037C5FFC2